MEEVNKVKYISYCIYAFARRYTLTLRGAFNYLQRFKALEFLEECYEAEHQLSIEDAVADMSAICRRNGGEIA